MRAYKRWTADQDAQLLFLREHVGLSFGEIDVLVERSPDSACGRYRVLRPRLFRAAVRPDGLGLRNVVNRARRLRAPAPGAVASPIGFVGALQARPIT